MATARTPTQNEAPTQNKQVIRSQRSTARMLDAASELIVERGYGAMTLAAIGERANYSRGLATSRFGSKQKLLEALVERITNKWSTRTVLPLIEGENGYDSLFIWLEGVCTQVERGSQGVRTLYALCFEALGPVPELSDRIVELHRELRAFAMDILYRGIGDRSIRHDVRVLDETNAIIAELRGVAYLWFLEPQHFDPGRAFRYLIETTKERLRPLPVVASDNGK